MTYHPCCLRCLFLQRFAVIGTEGIIAKELFQVVMNVEHAVAILAAIGALSMAEHIDDMFYFGIMEEYPTWGNRLVIVCAYESQGVCQAQGDWAARAGISAWAQI